MANQPIQLPNVDLPGAEYFSLAPNRTIALQGRRRQAINTNIIAVAPNTSAGISDGSPLSFGQLILETPFPQTAGIYVHKADLIVIPQDNTSELQITTIEFGVRTNTVGGAAYQFGTPLLSFATPGQSQQLASTERDLLITERDVELYSSPPSQSPSVLTAAFAIIVKNLDPTNPHSVQVAVRYIYTRLDGFVE